MVQTPATPRFYEDSALRRHWPLLWLIGLVALIVFGFFTDFRDIDSVFSDKKLHNLRFQTQYIFRGNSHSLYLDKIVDLGHKGGKKSEDRKLLIAQMANHFARVITNEGHPISRDATAQKQRETCLYYLRWLFHRRFALYFADKNDYDLAQSEFEEALSAGRQLPPNFAAPAISLRDLALFSKYRAIEMQESAQVLKKVFLPLFSLLAAILPFALVAHFIKSRDKVSVAGSPIGSSSVAMLIKSGLLVSWLALIVTGWIALRNFALGLATTPGDPTSIAFFATLGVFLAACGLMLRYMPPYKTLSLKKTVVRSGFGGMLLLVKAVAIYIGLCHTLAGHPALRDVLFCQQLMTAKLEQAKDYAGKARPYRPVLYLVPAIKDKVEAELRDILSEPVLAPSDIDRLRSTKASLMEEMEDLDVPDTEGAIPALWSTAVGDASTLGSVPATSGANAATVQNLTAALTFKACLAFLLLCYPEVLTYMLLGLKQQELAFKTFGWAVRIKEYFLGANHWIVVGMMQLLGSCLLTFHQANLAEDGENYIKEAIRRYESSRGRHDQFTIEAKMQLASVYSERGDDKGAERILLEALRDVGKDFDMLAYCALLSEIGKMARRQNNISRAKQMYKQVIEQLEQKLILLPPAQGFMAYWRSLYSTIPTWQLEVHLVHAYLDLAAVFYQAKYNGEAQRLIDDANRRIGAFERDLYVSLDVIDCYVDARVAQARILNNQRRFDECFKLLAASKKQIQRWGYTRIKAYHKFVINECELLMEAGKAFPLYQKEAEISYKDGVYRFGHCRAETKPVSSNAMTHVADSELHARWRAIGEALQKPDKKRSDPVAGQTESARPTGSQPPAGKIQVESGNAIDPGALSILQAGSLGALSGPGEEAGSKIIASRREDAEEGIILRWQRERKEEKMLEYLPE